MVKRLTYFHHYFLQIFCELLKFLCKSASSVSSLSLLYVILIARLAVLFIKLSAALLQNNHIIEQYCKCVRTICLYSPISVNGKIPLN